MNRFIKEALNKSSMLQFLVNYKRDEKFRAAFNAYLKSRKRYKPRSVVKKELELLRKYWNIPPFHYYRYKLYKKDLSEDELLNYIPPFYYFNIYWEKRNNVLDKDLYYSKIYQQQLFQKYNIPAIDIVAIKKNEDLIEFSGAPITIDRLLDQHLKTEQDGLFCKPEFGRGGKGIIYLSRNRGIIHINNRPVSIDKIMSFFDRNTDYIIQERFMQSMEMNQINDSSVNTLRIYTQFNNKKAELPACILRMGVNNSFVDNLSQGGLMNVINVDTGALSDFAQIKLDDAKYYEHPDSNYLFKGKRIELWNTIKLKILEYSTLLPDCKDLGWDVAISEDGFKVLEINIQHGIDHPQMIYGGMRTILKVYPNNSAG